MTYQSHRPLAGVFTKNAFVWAITVSAFTATSFSQSTIDLDEIAALKKRLETLEAKSENSSNTATSSVNWRGFEAKSANGSYSFRIRPRIQTDLLWFPDDDATDNITLRRVRPIFQGNAGPVSWRFTPELAGSPRILDAWADLRLNDNSYLRAGKAKGPIGLERLQSFSHTLFNERGLPSNLTPTRELGIQYFASSSDGKLDWSLGAYNGSLDDSDQSNNANLSSDLDVGARLFFHPFKGDQNALQGLGFGLGISQGTENATIDDSNRDSRLRYRSSGRNTIFRYNDGVAIDGERLRLNPGAYYYRGPFGFLTEYVRSSYRLSRGGTARDIDADGYTVQASWVVTGENATYGYVRPKEPYSLHGDNKGAFEIGLHYHTLEIDEAAFAGDGATRLARNDSVQKASAIGIAAKWYLTDNLLATLNYEVTDYSGIGADRDSEELIHTRLQVDF